MKTPTINSRVVKLEVLKGTATRTSVNAVESRTTSLESDVATLTQGIADAVSTHNTAPDSHADLRTLIGDRALSVHQHARTDLPWVTEPGAALLTAESASAQRTALGMTAWAVAPWTDGTTSDIPEGTQLYFTDARADARIAAQKGQAEGLAPLDAGGKVPSANLPDSIVGQVIYHGLWDASTNTPTLPTASAAQGYYYITSVAGVYAGIAFDAGDWCISDGTAWGKVDNSDAITSFAGRVGAILPIASDYSSFYLGLHAQADDAARLGGQLPSYYAQAGHTHNYAGSSTPGGAATTALACTGNAATATTAASCTGNAATATTLATARTLTIGSKANTFDGSADKAWTLAEIGAVASEARVSFTPTIRFETPGTGVGFDNIDATSSKVGSICVVHVGLRLTNIGSGASGALIISGFPNSPTQTGNDYSYHYATAYAGDNTPYAALFSRYAPNLYIYKPYINWGVGNYMNITLSYEC